MSLFQVRNFWSLDLENLWTQLEPNFSAPNYYGTNRAEENAGEETEADANERRASNASKISIQNEANQSSGSFVVAIGTFDVIGAHNVFVCGHLFGFLCLIQVPRSSELSAKPNPPEDRNCAENTKSELGQETSPNERQLLAAKHLREPIVDLKCGLFTSALKQSIVVLSFDHLRVFQVKLAPKETDLITGEPNAANEIGILSHNFEEIYKLDLLADQIAISLLVVNGHDSSLVHEQKAKGLPATNESKPNPNTVQQLHLPQKDRIVVQYANQFLLTLIEHKKVLGHFKWSTKGYLNPGKSDANGTSSNKVETNRMRQMSEHVGPMPMAHLKIGRTSNLAISLSNYNVFCVPVESLLSKARQSVLKRVTQNLLESSAANPPSALSYSSSSKRNAESSSQVDSIIPIDLDSVSLWSFDCSFAPLQIKCVPRRHYEVASFVVKDPGDLDARDSNVLVLTRHTLELLSSSGEHVWSQRFETPLTCMFAYTIGAPEVEASDKKTPKERSNKQKSRLEDSRQSSGRDSLITILCSDSLGGSDRSSLIFMKENLIEWSALVNAKPFEIWRVDLTEMSGYLALLDVKNNNLLVSYLGTNADCDIELEHEKNAMNHAADTSSLNLLESIDEPIFDEQDSLATRDELDDDSDERHLKVEYKLEASNQWPEVSVECTVRVQSNSSDVVHNIVAMLELHDNLIHLETVEPNLMAWSRVSAGVVQVNLGSCWPDRREPMSFVVRFSRRRGILSPKSLRVGLILHYQRVRPSGQSIQEEEILLPLTMVGKLEHIDYSSGQSQSLMDVLNNLEPFRFKCFESDGKQIVDSEQSSRYLCDLFMTSCGETYVNLLDRIIESDLLCRGRQFDVIGESACNTKSENLIPNTLENINLLAQSLDCRLKFRSSPSFTSQSIGTSLMRQTSEDLVAPVMFSIGFSVPSFQEVAQTSDNLSNKKLANESLALVWIHICDLSANGSDVVRELIRMHSNDWSMGSVSDTTSGASYCDYKNNVLLVFESNAPISVFFVLDHFVSRLKLDFDLTELNYMNSIECNRLAKITRADYDEDADDKLSIPLSSSMIVVNEKLMKYARKLKDRLEKLDSEYKKAKAEVELEFCKFQLCTSTSLSLSKRLSNLPEQTQKQFSQVNEMTRNYCLKLNRLLGELDLLKNKITCGSHLPQFSGLHF